MCECKCSETYAEQFAAATANAQAQQVELERQTALLATLAEQREALNRSIGELAGRVGYEINQAARKGRRDKGGA